MKYKFKNGAEVEGTVEQILEVAKALGETLKLDPSYVPEGYYHSEHSGLLKISEMKDAHLRNALIKRAKRCFDEIANRPFHLSTNEQFLTSFVSLEEDTILNRLFNELNTRK